MPPGQIPSNVRRDSRGRFCRAKRRSPVSKYFRELALKANRGRSKDEMRARYYANGLNRFQFKKRQPVAPDMGQAPPVTLSEDIRRNAEAFAKLERKGRVAAG